MMYSSKFTVHYLNLVKIFINEGNFVGEDVCYFSEYEMLEIELGKVFRCMKLVSLIGRRCVRVVSTC